MRGTLAREPDRAEIARRISSLTPASQRQWGTMSVGGMMCHLCDSYRMSMGEMTAELIDMPLPRPILKFVSLRLPMPCPGT